MAENGASPTSARRNASICRGRAPRHTATWHLDCPIHRISSKRNKNHYDTHTRNCRQSEFGVTPAASSRGLVWQRRIDLRPMSNKPLAFRLDGRRSATCGHSCVKAFTPVTAGVKVEQPSLAVVGAGMESPLQTFEDSRRQPTWSIPRTAAC